MCHVKRDHTNRNRLFIQSILNSNTMFQEDILICECSNTEHQIVFRYEEEDAEFSKFVYMSVHLCKLPFFQRLKYGFKYIFGYKCRYGAFDEVVLNPKDAWKLEKIAAHMKGE